MSKNLSFKMRKSMLSVAIGSSFLVVGNTAYANYVTCNNAECGNVGTSTYQSTDATKHEFYYQDGIEVEYKVKGVGGPAVGALGSNNFQITAGTGDGDMVTFQGGGYIENAGIIASKDDAQLLMKGQTVLVKWVTPADPNKIYGLQNAIVARGNSNMTFANKHTVVNVELESMSSNLIYARDNAKITFDGKLTVNGTLDSKKINNNRYIYGVRAVGGKIFAHDDVDVNLSFSAVNQQESANGVGASSDGQLTFDKNVTINLNIKDQGPSVHNMNAVTIIDGQQSAITIGGDLNVIAKGEKATGIYTQTGEVVVQGATNLITEGDYAIRTNSRNGSSKITLNGDVSINTGNTADKYWKTLAIQQAGGEVNINQNGGKMVNIHGGVKLSDSAELNMTLDNENSLFSGSIIDIDDDANSTLKLSDKAKWLVSDTENDVDTKVTNLTLSSGAIIDATQANNKYANLNIGKFSGTDGEFILDTNLASNDTAMNTDNGDKIKITSSDVGAKAFIQVKDASLANGTTVTGVKNLLVAEDASGNVTFEGKTLNTGGLWDVTPTIENGLNAKDENGQSVGTDKQWFLTKIEKALNNDTEVLVENTYMAYALWMNLTDTLRQRLGDVRGHGSDSGALWSRYVGGEFGDAINYNVLQVGYDKAFSANSLFGVAVETGLAEGHYGVGKEKDKTLALSLYGVWTSDKGDYLDAVAKIGRISKKLNSYGDNPDSANLRNHAYGFSLEYGRKIDFGKNQNLFVEPQIQAKYSRLRGTSYTTDRGTSVHTDHINSLVGRVGMLAGFKVENGSQFYAKFSALNEFLGKSNMSLAAANGDNTILRNRYRDTWLEIGVGTNIKLSDTSYFYGDVERSIKGDIDKKWQINAGLRFEF